MTEALKVQEDLGLRTKIKLQYPITIGTGDKLTELSVRRMTVGDMRQTVAMTNDGERELAIFARLTGLVPEDLDLLDFADYSQLQNLFRRLQGG